jgi:acetyl-CoA C-acetyltransferase
MGAEMMAKKFDLSKDSLDEYAFRAITRAIAATRAARSKPKCCRSRSLLPDGQQGAASHRRRHSLRSPAWKRFAA